jgi:hypothetical protein
MVRSCQLTIYIMDLRPGSLVSTRNHIPRNLKMAERFSRSPHAHARKRRPAHIEPVDARLDLRIVLKFYGQCGIFIVQE